MKFSEILPSKWLQRTIIIILGCVLLGLATQAFIKAYREDKRKREAGIEVSYVDFNSTLDQQDDDGDGVPNWEEILWGLDPSKADTDSDGVDDFRYVESRKETQRMKDQGYDPSSGLTETEKFGRSLYTALMAVEESGGVIDAETEAQISENIVEYIQSLPVASELYVRDGLNLVENTKENSYAYRDELKSLLVQYPIEQDDLELTIRAIENSEPYTSRIARLSDQYSVLVGKLADMEVPFAIGGRHTEFLNSVAHISETFKALNQPNGDDILLLAAIVQMRDMLLNAVDSLMYIETYFDIIADESVFELQ